MIRVEEQIHFNLALAQFFNNLENDHDREIAGKVINWIKETYPDSSFVKTLKGELVLEDIREK